MNNIDQVIQTFAVFAIPVLFAISLHEVAHGYVARYFGDNTAEQLGRLTANPIKHIDPIGTILLPLVLYWAGLPPFGYAKPTPIDYGKLRNPKKQMGFVAAAGPFANFAMGLAWMLLGVILTAAGVREEFLLLMCQAGVATNAMMFVINMIPVPPLDGGSVAISLLPRDLAAKYARLEQYGMFVFIGLVLLLNTGPFRGLISALIMLVYQLFAVLLTPFRLLLS
jgi:Zn-dependent protease